MGNKEKFDKDYLLYGEPSPKGLGCLAQGIIAIFKYFFNKRGLTINDARRLNDIHEKTGMAFPLKGEDFIKK